MPQVSGLNLWHAWWHGSIEMQANIQVVTTVETASQWLESQFTSRQSHITIQVNLQEYQLSYVTWTAKLNVCCLHTYIRVLLFILFCHSNIWAYIQTVFEHLVLSPLPLGSKQYWLCCRCSCSFTYQTNFTSGRYRNVFGQFFRSTHQQIKSTLQWPS
jgi:hypothetical protein